MKTGVILLICVALVKCQTMCPSKEDIKPCVCKIGVDGKPWISCESVKTSNDLVRAVANMKALKAKTFYIEKSDIGFIPPYIFQDMEIDSLYILDSNLTKLGEGRNLPPFIGLENSLTYLEIRAAFVNASSPLTLLSVSHLKKLTAVQLERNIIPVIGNNWFESGPYGLSELYLLSTKTTKVGSHAFQALENLKKISLTGGYISEISRDMFPMPATFLKSIDLSNNRLKTLPSDVFTKMPSLEDVFLENNALSSINELTWSPVWSQLQHVFFYENRINCNEDMKWIYKYRLPENFKGHCAAPPRLQSRDFSKLTISDFD